MKATYINNSFTRFLASGVFNTGITYVAYLLLNIFLDYKLAYSISYIMGIIIAYLINSLFVFKVQLSMLRLLIYPIIYLVQYLINLLILVQLVRLDVSEQAAPIVVIVVTLPLVYVLNKIILAKIKLGR